MGWCPRQSGSPTSRLTCHAYPLRPGSQPVCAKATSYPESRVRWEGRNRVPRELRSEEVVPRSHQSLKEEQATPMWRASSSAWPLSPVQRGESHTRPPPSPQSLALLWEGAILRARSWIMSHSGCYGPLPGLGHHILANAAGPSKNSITASKNHMETEKEHLIISKYQKFQTSSPGGRSSLSPYLPAQSPVSHSFCEASGQATGSQKPARG